MMKAEGAGREEDDITGPAPSRGRAALRLTAAGGRGQPRQEVGYRCRVLRAGLRMLWRAMPVIGTTTVVPLLLFYIAMAAGSVAWGIGVSVAYVYLTAAYQYLRRRRVSGMLLMTVLLVTLRALGAAVSGHVFVYFVLPVAETGVFGLLFLATMATREPLIVRLARDMVPHLADELADRKGLVTRLSLVWTLTYLASGATTLLMLLTVSLPVYLGAHQLAGWLWVAVGIGASVLLCRRHGNGLLSAAFGSLA